MDFRRFGMRSWYQAAMPHVTTGTLVQLWGKQYVPA